MSDLSEQLGGPSCTQEACLLIDDPVWINSSAYFECLLYVPGTGLGVRNTETNDINTMLLELGHDLVGAMPSTKICNGLWKVLLVEKCTTYNIKSGESVNLLNSLNWVRLDTFISKKHINGIYLFWGNQWESWWNKMHFLELMPPQQGQCSSVIIVPTLSWCLGH